MNTNEKTPKINKIYADNKELRVLEVNDGFIFVTRDICEVLGVSYHMSKLSVVHDFTMQIKIPNN